MVAAYGVACDLLRRWQDRPRLRRERFGRHYTCSSTSTAGYGHMYGHRWIPPPTYRHTHTHARTRCTYRHSRHQEGIGRMHHRIAWSCGACSSRLKGCGGTSLTQARRQIRARQPQHPRPRGRATPGVRGAVLPHSSRHRGLPDSNCLAESQCRQTELKRVRYTHPVFSTSHLRAHTHAVVQCIAVPV